MKNFKPMHPWRDVGFVLACASFSTCAVGTGLPPSFDCRKATTDSENAICESPELSDLDGQLGRAFGDLIAIAKPDRLKDTRADQAAWIRSRDATCKGDKGCLGIFIRQRILVLKTPQTDGAGTHPSAPLAAEAEQGPTRGRTPISAAPSRAADTASTSKPALADKVWYWDQKYYCSGDPHYGIGKADPAYGIGNGEYISEAEARRANVSRSGVSVPCSTKLEPLATCNDGRQVYYVYSPEHRVVETSLHSEGYDATGASGTKENEWTAAASRLAEYVCGQGAPRTFHGPVAKWDVDFKSRFDAQAKAHEDDRLARMKKARQSSDCVSTKSRWDNLIEVEKTRELTIPEIRKKADVSAAAEAFNCGKLDEPWD